MNWTRNQADVIDAPSGTATDPDVAIGNVVKGCVDAGLIWFTQNCFNFSGYPDGIGRLDGRGLLTHRFSLEHAPRAYEVFDRKEDGCVKCVLLPQA